MTSTVSELSELQLDLMRVLWRHREASAAEVQAHLAKRRPLAITTVSTLLSRLEKRGLVAHRSEGRVFVYHATVSEPQVRRSMLRSLVDSLFMGDRAAVVSQLLADGDVAPGDIDKMQALIDDGRKKKSARRGKGA
jgi:BlaI family penicillinase repressor